MKVGASYYPELLPADDWEADLQLGRSLGFKVLRCGESAWSAFAPDAATWNSRWAVTFLDQAFRHDYEIVWCTPSATPPPYLFDRWSNLNAVSRAGQMMPVGEDRRICPSHPGYLELCMVTAERMAHELAGHPAIKGWQIDIERAGDGFICCCERCQRSFHEWLRQRYQSLNEMNRLWQSRVGSQVFTDWAQVPPPMPSAAGLTPPLNLAYRRFHSELWLSFYRRQYEALKRGGAQRVTAGFSHLSQAIHYNQWSWRPWLDAVGLSCHCDDLMASRFQLALLQGTAADSRPLWVLEQTVGQGKGQSLYPDNLARLEQHLRIGANAGAEYAICGPLRQPCAGPVCEHGAMLRHDGRPTRIARVMQEAIRAVQPVVRTPIPDDLLLVFSFEQQWGNEVRPRPGIRWDYRTEIEQHWFGAVCELREPGVRIGAPAEIQGRFSLILAPYMQMAEPGLTKSVYRALMDGATVVTTADFCRLDQEGCNLRNPPLAAVAYWTSVPDLDIMPLQQDFLVPGDLSGTDVNGRIFWAVPETPGTPGLGRLEHGGLSGPAALDFRIGKGRLLVVLTALDRVGVRQLLKLLL